MRKAHKWTALLATSTCLFQITACLGSDPQLFLTNVTVSTLVSNIVTTLYQFVLGGLTA